jgi:CHAT domain-containing protein
MSLSQLSLSAELVTLSGCETARGQLHGTDLISLATSFVGAGAKALLISLWRVDDAATAQLMGEVYQAIKQGHNKAMALQQAQRRLLELGRTSSAPSVYCHPAFWAPFILIGEPRPIT